MNNNKTTYRLPSRLLALLLLLITLGSVGVWGQTDYSGMYYIGNYNNNAYNVETPANNFYLVPAANPQQTHHIDAYYSANYGSEDGDPDRPFLTTYKTNKDANSVWRIEASGESGFYYIIHQNTGRYVIYEPVFTGDNSRRKSMHLKETNTPGDEAKFAFTTSKSGYAIRPKLVETGNCYFNVASANTNAYNSVAPTSGTATYYNGLVGLYSDVGDKNGVWILEQATIDPPTITNNLDGTITIAAASGATIYYTTDGSTPTMSSPVYSTAITLTEDITVIKAIAKASADPFPTIVRTYEIPQCDKPNISVSGNYVSITCPTAGATIYYTTDNTPATTASAVYTVPFVKGSISTIRAVATSHGYIISSEAILLPPTEVSSSDEITDMRASYILASNFTSSGSIGTSENPFKGTIDGNFNQLTLNNPLVAYADGAIIKNVILSSVSISSGTNVGAICNEATGDTRIYNCGVLSGSVGGSNNVGGIVGLLDGRSRVINCYSYANITSGTNAGGIVGYNNVATIAENIRTMVMNCMFYGDITGGTNVSPVYGGETINNLQGGLNNFNYYSYTQLTTATITKYNCALAVEDKFLNRFEYYRLLLNSNKKLAAFYATGSHDNANEMAKWVLETANRTIDNPKPYPILKTQGYYPSIVNPDIEHAPDSASVGRNHGGKLGKTLSVTISGVGSNAPSGASITTGNLTLQRTDKDFDRFNFNYDKVQLPYYNDVGTGNYTESKVVTGWKITAITAVEGDPYTSANYPTTGITDFPNHNYADRKSSKKDLYSVSKRVFSQGAYFDVPYGVESITIEPYWGTAVYVADQYYDVVYKNDYTGKQGVSQVGTQAVDNTTEFNGQKVRTSITGLGSGTTVYDNAVVLVGNFHLDGVPSGGTVPFTMMSVDMDNDHEPDYSLIYHHKGRTAICPIRFDFLNIPGTAQAQKPNGASLICNFTIFKTKGWFEVTNTSSFYTSQLEYENQASLTKSDAPLILLGGVIDQFVSTQSSKVDGHTIYIHVGGNVWINEFGMGTHSDGSQSTPHVPVSVTGGEFPGFYLTGTYKADAIVRNDNAECYISGGYIHEAAGASLEQIGGNVRWQIYNADIENFFGGGINDAKPIKGDITTDIYNSHVTLFCGGPKFGNMQTGKKVSTNAEGCTFGKYFGAGYGGLSYSKKKYYDKDDDPVNWTTQQSNYTNDRGKYYDGKTTELKQGGTSYGFKGPGVATDFDYEYFVWTSGKTGGRFYVKFASFSLAQCNDVSSTLKKCTIENNFYGGGNLGKVVGTATSMLEDCTVKGSVYGAGYSASLPTVEVRDAGFTKAPNFNKNSGMFEPAELSGTTTFTWQNATVAGKTLTNGQSGSNLTNHILYTDIELTGLGEVAKTVLTINGTTTVGESVYGGGEESVVAGDTEVNVTGGTIGTTGKGGARWGNVFGGGKGKEDDVTAGQVKGNTNVTISGTTETTKIIHNVYGGGAFGSVGTFTYDGTTGFPNSLTENTGTANITITGGTFGSDGKENGMIFGSSRGSEGDPAADTNIDKIAWVGNTNVVIGTQSETPVLTNPKIAGSVYGGGENGHNYQNAQVTIHSGTIGITNPETDGGARYPYRGNAYGGGCGTDTFDRGEGDDKKTYYDFNAGIVLGNTQVDIDGGHIVHNVYGGGAMGSVGTYTLDTDGTNDIQDGMPLSCAENTGLCTINITGGKIGMTNATMQGHGTDGPDDFGHVFGAGRGYSKDPNLYPNIESCAFFNNTQLTISDKALVCGSVYGGSESGHVLHNTNVEINGGQIGCGVGKDKAYTDDEFASSTSLPGTAHWQYTAAGMGAPHDQYANMSGTYDYTGDFAYIPEADRKATSEGGLPVATDGRTFYGNVFAGGSGYYPYAPGLWLKSAGHIGGTASVTVTGGHILNNLYGGCEMADIDGAVTVTMTGGTIGVPRTAEEIKSNPNYGNIYGAGMGDKRIFFNTSTNIASTTIDISNGTVYGAVYGGGEDGHVMGDVVTTISQPAEKTTIIGCDGTSGYDGNVFGAGQGHIGALTAGVVGGNASLTITGGTLNGSAYGGGRIASVGTYFAMADDPKYGKMQEGDDHGNLSVSLTGGTIYQNVYGGCMGTTEDVAYGISKNVSVELNKDKGSTDKGCVVKGDIFGCNNVNSSPEGTSTVHIYATQHEGKSQIGNTTTGETPVTDAKVEGSYDVRAVYGGGNLAAYTPKDLDNGTTDVIIDGCQLTSIQTVYGGGNAASTPATKVTIIGTYEIDELFGGGNGKDAIGKDAEGNDIPNPGANVGFYAYANDAADAQTPEDRATHYGYGTGQASVNVFGGTIHRVFGGSNTKGNVRQTAVTLLDENSGCPFCVNEAYGGGKSAPMDAEAKLLMACIPGLQAAYGGAEAAAIKGNVTLNITNGTFDRVFGGNNLSGTIDGSITVNIEEVGCRPIKIGELYGGGNQAAYSVYGYNADGTPIDTGDKIYDDPQINVMSFTSIGKIFGGGYGERATMVGNPTVNVNEVYGKYYDDDASVVGENAETPNHYPIPSHDKGKMGAIHTVFGGGNAAKVMGNTTVNIATLSDVYIVKQVTADAALPEGCYTRSGAGTTASPYVYTPASGTASANETYYEKQNVLGADIRDNVYGGGNNAEVTGNTSVNIGKKAE